MSDHAATVREYVTMYGPYPVGEHQRIVNEAIDAFVAERDEAIACLQRVVEADRDDSRMGHPNAGDSCIGACIGLDVMPWLDQRGKLLPFVTRAALAEEDTDE